MENYGKEKSCASAPTVHPFKFEKEICVFCALPLHFREQGGMESNWDNLDEYTFSNGVSILCETLNVKENLNRIFGDGGRMDNWRLVGIDNFVGHVCCERCYKLITQLVSLQQFIVKSQISLKENARKLEDFVVVSSQTDDPEAPSVEYSVNTCALLRQEILNNFSRKNESSPPEPEPRIKLPRKPKSFSCQKQPIVLLKRLDESPPIKQDNRIPPFDNEEFSFPSPPSPETMETDEDADAKDEKNDQMYRPTRGRRRPTRRKIGSPKIASSVGKHTDSRFTKGRRPFLIGNRHVGTGPKVHPTYFLSMSPSNNQTYLMVYNAKFCKTPTSLRCLHPQCTHQETLPGNFTDQIILRNMRFHIRFAHRSPPKKEKPEENKPSFYYCHSCESQLNGKLNFLEHCRKMHAKENQFPPFCYCEVCGDPSVPWGDLTQHLFSHKSELEKDANLRKGIGKLKDILKPLDHPCDQCDKSFKCHTELMTHRKTHLPIELRLKFVCEFCGKGFINASAVEIHKRRVHLKDLPMVFECHICGKGFTKGQKRRWKEHLNMHTGEKPYQCEQCGKGFIGSWHLIKHVRAMHRLGGKASFTCEFCGKIYKEESYLRKHSLKKHRDKAKITGRVLGEWEEDKDKYKPLEQRIDFIGPKLMFPCEPCQKVYIYRSMLITHLKNRHKMFYERKEEYPWRWTLEDATTFEANTLT